MRKVNKILLIDDNKTTAHINQWEINKLGIAHEVKVAENGILALEYLQLENQNGQDSPDLILLDHHMPIMNGFEFFQEYKNLDLKGNKAVLIMLTTSMHQQLLTEAKNYGLAEVISKPLTQDKLKTIWAKHFPSQE